MIKRNVVIRPLQEELRLLGILEDQDQEEPAPQPDPEGGYAGESDDEEPKDEPDVAKTEDEDDPEKKSDDEVETEAKQAIRTLSTHFLGVHEQDDAETEPEDDEEPVARGPNGEPVGESKMHRLRRLAEGKIFSGRPKTNRPKSQHRVTALLEEVSGIVGDIHRSRREDRIQGFANIAVISEMLSRRFRRWGMSLSEGTLYKVGEMMAKLHEQAADIAIGLDTPPGEKKPEEQDEPPVPPTPDDEPKAEQDDAQVDEMFKKLMAKLLDALQLYNDVTGKGDETQEIAPQPEPPGAGEDDETPDDDEEPDEAKVGLKDSIPPEIKSQAGPPVPPPPPSDDDDEEPEEEDDEDPDADPDEPKGECGECMKKEGDESPYGQPPEEDDKEVTEARRRLAELRKRLVSGRRGRKEALTVSGKAPKTEKKGKKRR